MSRYLFIGLVAFTIVYVGFHLIHALLWGALA